MSWWFAVYMIIATPVIWWQLWRDNFDGMRTEYEIKKRPKLEFDEFYARFYSESGILQSTVASMLAITSEQFGIPKARQDELEVLDGTFDNIVHYIDRELATA